MTLQTLAQTTIQADIERVFDYSTDCQNMPKLFTGYQIIPGIASATTDDGLPLREGGQRIVRNQDGSVLTETITGLQRPHLQAYQFVGGLKAPLSWLVSAAGGEWRYERVDQETLVTWKFWFDTRNALANFIFDALIRKTFQGAQQQCLEQLKQQLESEKSD